MKLMVALVACLSLGMPALASEREPEDEAPLCLGLSENGNALLTLRILRRSMLEPDEDGVRLVRSILNHTDPALGVAARTARDTVLMNLSGTVAGFFVALRIDWNARTHAGTGRLVGELSTHPALQVREVSCQ